MGNRYLKLLDEPCIWTEQDLYPVKPDPGLGVKGRRSDEHPCDGFDPGPMAFDASCDTDGHYVCSECRHMGPRAREERSEGERDLPRNWTRHQDTYFYRIDRHVAAVQGFRKGLGREWTVLLVKGEKSFHHFKTRDEAFRFAEQEVRR